MKKEIVERSSGYWIVDGHGFTEGPFIELDEEVENLKQLEKSK